MTAPAALPTQFGRYRIVESLGAGGMGSVYLAEDTMLSRKVAIKVPHLTQDDGPPIRERFLREARAAAAIDHPNLCPIHDIGECNGIPFLVMPFLEGKPLSRLVDEQHPWPPVQALALVKKLAAALDVLHGRGLIHRDLKPSNVMIRGNGEPVVMDFGLAKSLTSQTRQLTKLGSMLGTPSYMAPEQVLGDLNVLGPATDVYSLGVILYQLLTGQLPFEGPATLVCAQILHAVPEAPSAQQQGLEPWLDAVCLKALAKKLPERYASMTALLQALDAPAPLPATMYTTIPDSHATKAQILAQPTQLISLPKETVLPPASITCPKCNKVLKVPAGLEGKKVFCPRCKTYLARLHAAAPETPAPSLGATAHEQPTAKGRQGMKAAALVALLLCLPAAWLLFGPKGDSGTKPEEKPDPTSKAADKPDADPKPPQGGTLDEKPSGPLHLRLQPSLTLRAGASAVFEVGVDRRACQGPADIWLLGLPNSVAGDPAILAADKDTAQIGLTAAAAADETETEIRVLVTVGTTTAEERFKLSVKKPNASLPFRAPMNGLAEMQFADASSFPEKWRKGGTFAEVDGAGIIAFPSAAVSRYVLEAELELRAAGQVKFVLGGPGDRIELAVEWSKDREAMVCRLYSVKDNVWYWNGEHVCNLRERLRFKLAVEDGRQVLFQGLNLSLELKAASDNLKLEIHSSEDTAATIYRCSFRPLTAADWRPGSPNDVQLYLQHGGAHYEKKNYQLALTAYSEAARRDPNNSYAHNQLAWRLATCPEGSVRDGRRAIESATQACKLTNWNNAGHLDTLAAAHAEAGQFEEAVKRQQEALDMVGEGSKPEYRSRLELYQAGKPFRE